MTFGGIIDFDCFLFHSVHFIFKSLYLECVTIWLNLNETKKISLNMKICGEWNRLTSCLASSRSFSAFSARSVSWVTCDGRLKVKMTNHKIYSWNRPTSCSILVLFLLIPSFSCVKYGYENYKSNIRMMDAYCRLDLTILKSGNLFRAMPENIEMKTPDKRTRKKRTRDSFELSSPEMKPKARKIVCLLSSSDSEWILWLHKLFLG